jgi:hypothetical protein
MKFSPEEIRYIKQLQRAERTWRWERWVSLLLGTLSCVPLVLYGARLFTLFYMMENPDFSATAAAELGSLCTACFVVLAVALSLILRALSKWRGDPTRILLLRLLESEQRESPASG